jgi:hypothetical protein
MPFKSKKQSKACFATHGFGNKVNCKEWANATNYKNLKMNYRGKKQTGGQFLLDGSWSPGYLDKKTGVWVSTGDIVPPKKAGDMGQIPVTNPNPAWENTPSITPSVTPSQPYNPFGTSPWLARGQANPLVPTNPTGTQIPMSPDYKPPMWHNTPEDVIDGQTFDQRLPDDHPYKDTTGQSVGTYDERAHSTDETTTSNQPAHNWNTDIFLGLRGAQMAASYLVQKKRNNRLNDYAYKQDTALGQMNPIPVSQFQYSNIDYTTPNRLYAQEGGMINPYSQHAKYGGNLKRIIKDYEKWTNDAPPMDMGEGAIDDKGKMKKGGFALDEMIVNDFIRKLMQFGSGPHPYKGLKRAQKGGRQPITVTNPNDPRLKAYNDSLNLFKAYEFQKKNANYKPLLEEYSKSLATTRAPMTPEQLGKIREKNMGKVGATQKLVRAYDYNSFKKNPSQNFDPMKTKLGDNKIYDYYRSLSFNEPVAIGKYSSPDIVHKNIRPVGEYFDGIATSPVYKKPVQPIVYNKDGTPVVYQKPQPNKSTIQKAEIKKYFDKDLETLNLKEEVIDKPAVTASMYVDAYGSKVSHYAPLPRNFSQSKYKNDNGLVPIGLHKTGSGEQIFVYPSNKSVEVPEKIFPAPVAGQSRPAKITVPTQSQMPEQQGDPVYGPANSVIGYYNNGQFTPYQGEVGVGKDGSQRGYVNSPDTELMKNPEELKKFLRGKGLQFKKGGFMGINPAHKGWCTPLSNPHCTGARKRLALTLKEHHGFHKKK